MPDLDEIVRDAAKEADDASGYAGFLDYEHIIRAAVAKALREAADMCEPPDDHHLHEIADGLSCCISCARTVMAADAEELRNLAKQVAQET